MKSPSTRNALLVCGLAVFFSWAFFFLKHNPSLRDIIPFADDPYDAVGSFAVIAADLLAITSLARLLLPYFAGRNASIYPSRTQAAISLCVLMTVSADAIAMLRHLSQWRRTPGETALLTILGSLMAASIGVLIILSRRSTPRSVGRWATPSLVFLASLLCLWFYPESLIRNTLPHLLTIDLADLLLFAPVASFVVTLFPNSLNQHPATTHVVSATRRFGAVPRWTLAALVGFAVGLAAFLAEIRDSATSLPIARLAFVGSVYAGLGLSGLLIAYAFLRKPLGFEITRRSAPVR